MPSRTRAKLFAVALLALGVLIALGGQHRLLAQGVVYRLYTAAGGERLEEVAQKFNVTVEMLRKYNSGLSKDGVLKAGELLLIPLMSQRVNESMSQRVNESMSQRANQQTSSATASWIYKVQPGDTLQSIAQKFGVSLQALLQENRLTAASTIVVGQQISIPIVEQAPPPISHQPSAISHQPSATSHQKTIKPANQQTYKPSRWLGVIGTIIKKGGRIRVSSSPKASTLFTCPLGSRLVLVDERGEWFGVLMINGSVGWIHKKYVRREKQTLDLNFLLGAYPSRGVSGDGVVSEALRYLGVPYYYGGNSLWGIDCSALVQRVFLSHGIRLPRTAAHQANVGLPVSLWDLRPGDRLYFSTNGRTINHCGIYIGDGQFVHASRRHGMVTISSLYEPRYWRIFVRAMR